MKRTERITICLSKEEKAKILLGAASAHLSMSAFIRNLVLAERRQYIPTANPQTQQIPKRRLSPIPGTPEYQYTQNKQEVIIELKVNIKNPQFESFTHNPPKNIEELERITKQQMLKREEELLREVEIK